jgi:hypothetical protein
MHDYPLLPCKVIVRCKKNSFENSIFSLSSIFGTCKNNSVCLLLSILSDLIPCKCVETTHNRASYKITHTFVETN